MFNYAHVTSLCKTLESYNMHINEVERILKEFIIELDGCYELKQYNDDICCDSDFVLLHQGREYAYIKFDESGKAKWKTLNVNEEKMGTARYYIVVRDTDSFIPLDLHCVVYPRNGIKSAFTCKASDLLEKLKNHHYTNQNPLTIEALAAFFSKSYSSLIRGRMQSFVSLLKEETTLENVVEDYGCYFMLTPKYEQLFFCALLGSVPGIPKRMCRYTSLSSLFRTLSDKHQSMCGVVCMNDKSESDYAFSFLESSVEHSNVVQRLKARNVSNSTQASFILSGSRMSNKDNLNMWRLYGDNSKGVCLWYDVDANQLGDFLLSRVSYGKQGGHAELTYLSSKLGKGLCGRNFEIRNLLSWMLFFKPSEYAVEDEVRLLFEMENINQLDTFCGKWILNNDNGIIAPVISFPVSETDNRFPLILSRIVLGPNMRERDVNKIQLQKMITQKGIKVSENFEISFSEIDNYRN